MQKFYLLVVFFAYWSICVGQKPKTIIKKTRTYTLRQTETYYRLGNRNIGVVVYKYNNNPGIVMVNVHDDEVTAIETSKQVLRKTGGILIKIKNDSQRLISFRLNNALYRFDPNRMFTETGIIASLRNFNCYSPVAVEKIRGFANYILKKIPPGNGTLIALHNNHHGDYSIQTYDSNGDLSTDSRATYIDSIRATDDFFLTTDEILYNKIRGFGYNVTLQNNYTAKDDGSLSIYYGKRSRSYVNVETVHGKPEVQFNMLMTVINAPKRKNVNSYIYNYAIGPPVEEKDVKNLKIYFGDKPVGNLLSAYYAQAYNKIIGQLEIENSFNVYSNTDLFLLLKNNSNQLEVRIDPTRERKPFDRMKETIEVVLGGL